MEGETHATIAGGLAEDADIKKRDGDFGARQANRSLLNA